MKIYRSVGVRYDTHDKLMKIKIKTKAKSVDLAIKQLIKLYNQYQKEVNKNGTSNRETN